MFNESKEFFLDLINANFENVDGPSDGSLGTYTYNLILQYGKKSDYIKMSKNNLNPSKNVWFCDEKGRDIYPTNGYMTYKYYKRMFNLIDKYEILLSDVEWEEIEFHC